MNHSSDLEDLSHLSGDVIEGAFKSICAAMLLRAAQELCATTHPSQEGYARKRAVKSWLYSGTGIITFEEACDAINLASRLYLERLRESAENLAKNPKNIAANTRNRFVFGRQINASTGQSQAAGTNSTGMVAYRSTDDNAR